MRKNGFSLIELLVVIAITGVLAAIAVPAYRAYQIRTNNVVAISTVNPILDDIAKYYVQHGVWPTSVTFAGNSMNLNQNGGWNYVTYNNVPSIVAIQYGCNTGPSSPGVFLWIFVNSPGSGDYRGTGLNDVGGIFVAIKDNNGVMQYACGADGINTAYLPSGCQTDIKVFTGTGYSCF